MGFFGKTETEWGYRFNSRDVWVGSKSEAEKAIKRMNKSVKKGGTPAKLIQRSKKVTAIRGREKDKCEGGKCKRNGFCRKHARKFGRDAQGNILENGKNRNNARWDEPGHRWG
jgi:hypothetical protein